MIHLAVFWLMVAEIITLTVVIKRYVLIWLKTPWGLMYQSIAIVIFATVFPQVIDASRGLTGKEQER